MKTKMKQIGILIIMIFAFLGNANAQYEITFLNGNNEWVFNAYGRHNSNANYKHPSISGIGGDTIYANLVDTITGDIETVDYWVIGDHSNVSDTVYANTLSYVLPSDSIRSKFIHAFKNGNSVEDALVFPKFLPPSLTLATNGTTTKAIEGSTTLTLSDFNVVVNTSGGGCSAHCDSVYWYCNGILAHSGIDTSYTTTVSGDYYIMAKLIYVTNRSIDTCKFTRFKSSKTISVDVDVVTMINEIESENTFKVYPNPTSDFLNTSIEVEYVIYSIAGEKIIEGFGNKINVSSFTSGTYMLITHKETIRFIVY